jgi:hypothetical protein
MSDYGGHRFMSKLAPSYRFKNFFSLTLFTRYYVEQKPNGYGVRQFFSYGWNECKEYFVIRFKVSRFLLVIGIWPDNFKLWRAIK